MSDPMNSGDIGMGSLGDEFAGVGSVNDYFNGLSGERVDPQQIANAIKDVVGSFRGDRRGGEGMPLTDMLFILGFIYLTFKVLESNVRD